MRPSGEYSASNGRGHVKSAVRVLDILDALAKEPNGLSFTELLRVLSFPKSSLHELLAGLTDRGYVEFDGERRTYGLGIRVWENGQAYLRHRDLVREARPVMEEIVRAVNETVQLAILDGIENVYLAKVDCSHPVRLQSEVGKRLFAYATGLGKVLLAHLPEDELVARLAGRSLPRFTPNTVTDEGQMRAELAIVRERGFAVEDQEYTPGLRCIAVPVLQPGGLVTAAMSASIPIMRANAAQLSLALSSLASGSLELSRRLGCAGDDPRLAALRALPAAEQAVVQLEKWDVGKEERASIGGDGRRAEPWESEDGRPVGWALSAGGVQPDGAVAETSLASPAPESLTGSRRAGEGSDERPGAVFDHA